MNELTRIEGTAPLSGAARVFHEPPPEEAIDLRRTVGTLLRHKWHILLLTTIAVVPVAIWTLHAEPLYRASTLIELEPDPVQVLPYQEIDRRVDSQFEMFLKAQDAVLRGGTLMERVRARLAKEHDGRLAQETSRLDKRVSIQRLENTYMFQVSYLAPVPQVAASVANIYGDEYIKYRFEARQDTREKARVLLQRELTGLESRVQDSEKGLVDYAQAHQLPFEEKATSPAHTQLDELATMQTKAEADVFAAQSRLAGLRQARVDDFPETLMTTTIAELSNKLLSTEQDLTSLQATFGANWPAVISKKQELVLTRDQLLREKRVTIANAVEQAKLNLAVAENQRASIARRFAAQQMLVDRMDNATIEYNIIRREVDTNKKLYDGMLERLRQTSITSGMEFGGIHIAEPATPPTVADSPKLLWNLGLASIVGIALGICFVLGRDYWDRSVWTIEEVERLTALPALGTVPLFREPNGRRFAPWRSGNQSELTSAGAIVSFRRDPPRAHRFEAVSSAAEAVRNVCVSILLSRSDRPPRTLMVTSGVPGEGKTTLARELAYAFNERGARTVLVECDFRRPVLAEAYGLSDTGGLTAWLAGITVERPLVHETEDGLSIVVAGPRAPNPVVLLNSERLKSFIADLHSSYRFVILDSSPALAFADARVLATLADGVVIVARAGKSQGPQLRAVRAAMGSVGALVLGTILNGTDAGKTEDYLGEYT